MTRINCVPVGELMGKHLVAEYRELPRVCGLVARHVAAGRSLADVQRRQPAVYTLGRGHVLFFYTRLLWLSWRHVHLVNEMGRRGYHAQFKENLRVSYANIPQEWWDDWEPDDAAMAINRARIEERLK